MELMTARLETRQHQADGSSAGAERNPRNREARRHPEAAIERAWREETTISVPRAGRVLGVGRNSAYGAAQAGEIPTIRIGGRLVVPVAALRRKLGELA